MCITNVFFNLSGIINQFVRLWCFQVLFPIPDFNCTFYFFNPPISLFSALSQVRQKATVAGHV